MKACFIITTVSFNYEKSNWLCSCRLALENVSFCFSQHVQHLGLSCMSIFCEKGWMLRLLHNSVAGSCIVFTAAEEIKFPKRCHDVFFLLPSFHYCHLRDRNCDLNWTAAPHDNNNNKKENVCALRLRRWKGGKSEVVSQGNHSEDIVSHS